MKLEGNYNQGIYNPPSGLDAVRYSEQAQIELTLKLNNLKSGEETGFKQNNSTVWPKFSDPDIELINNINNRDIDIFTQMLREGWRKNEEEVPRLPPTPTPDNKMPAGWIPTVPSLPPLNTSPGLYYVRTTHVSADGNYWYDDGNGSTNYYVIPPQTGKLREPRISPPEEPRFCIHVTQQNIDASTQSGGGVFYRPGGIDSAYPMAHLINRIEISSPSKYMAPFGLIMYEQQTYYRRIRIIKNLTGFFGITTIGMIIANPLELSFYSLNSRDEGEYWEWMEWELIRKLKVELIKCGASPPPPIYRGGGVPPPSNRRKEMQCCNCNDIATIVENQAIVQLRAQQKLVEDLKNHIDARALEIIIKNLEHLKALNFEDFLKVILNRINETESNLWNGINQ